jgi:hypothetical protein
MDEEIRQRGGNVGDLNLPDEASAPRRERVTHKSCRSDGAQGPIGSRRGIQHQR